MATSVDTEEVEVYLDHAASTPLRPEAQTAWLDASAHHHANPTGAHRAARAARRALDEARDEIAAALDRPPAEVVFTSVGREADNLAIRGDLHARGGIAVCSAGEHHAVLEPVDHAGGRTGELEADGPVSPDRLAAVLDAADQPVSVVSIMAINNETGVVNDIPTLVEVTRRHAPGVVSHRCRPGAGVDRPCRPCRGGRPDLDHGSQVRRAGRHRCALCWSRGRTRCADPRRRSGARPTSGHADVAGAAAFAAAATATVAARGTDVERLGALEMPRGGPP